MSAGDGTGGAPRPGDPLANAGFADGARYHAARPDYPGPAVDWLVETLGIAEGTTVIDLGAGTGIFTAQLLPYGPRIIAVEPTPGMRRELAARLPDITVVEGRDVAVPLPDATADVVVVAQAFHWFDAPPALREIHRLLRPGGTLGLVWNERDESVGWVAEVGRAMQWPDCQPYPVGMDFGPVLSAGPFADVERRRFSHTQRLDRAGLLQRVLTTSYVAVMAPDQRDALMADVAAVVEQLPEPVDLPYVTDAYRATAVIG